MKVYKVVVDAAAGEVFWEDDKFVIAEQFGIAEEVIEYDLMNPIDITEDVNSGAIYE